MCNQSLGFAQDSSVREIPWYETARVFYDWIRIGEDLDEDYARHIVQKTKDMNCNTLAFCVHVGGYALWNSSVSPKYKRIGDMDLIGELARLCNKNDIYFVPYWLGTAPSLARILKEHPSWAFLGAERDGESRRWHYVCYNSPYRDMLFEEVREVLGAYDVDVVLPEFYQSNDLIPLGEKHRITRAYFNNGTIWGNVRHAVRHDARHFPLCGTQMLLVDCVANRAAPLMLDLSAIDFDPTGSEKLAETFSDISEIQNSISHSQEVPYALLLHSSATYQNYLEDYMESFEGLYRLLFEAHIPFDVTTEENIQAGSLVEANVLIIPDAVFLSDATAEVVRTAVRNGMGLVATHMTGFRDVNGQLRTKPVFADIFGIEVYDVMNFDTRDGLVMYPDINVHDIDTRVFYYGSARTNHKLAQELPKNCLFSFQGGFVACSSLPGTQVLADIHTPDHSRLYAEEYARRGVFPGAARWPLATVRTFGSARVAYFAPQADAQWRRAHAPELTALMENTIVWAGGIVPLSTPDVPVSVEVRLFHDNLKQHYTILLVNHTTNPLSAPGDAHIGVIRYITSHKNLELVLHADIDIKRITSLIGSPVECNKQNKSIHVLLSKLDLYDGIVIEYE